MSSAFTLLPQEAEPTWEIAHLFPVQGKWSEEDYFELETNHLVEFTHGRLEVLPMPTQSHQFITLFLYRLLLAFVAQKRLGTVLAAPLRVQIAPGKYREPDVVFMFSQNKERRKEKFWIGADLVMEVISPDDPDRDRVKKRQEYATAKIAEYWLVDPSEQTITVLALRGQSYQEQGLFHAGEEAVSALLPGFMVDVEAIFAAAQE